eukprot:1494633-Amphidinium_carterae.1
MSRRAMSKLNFINQQRLAARATNFWKCTRHVLGSRSDSRRCRESVNDRKTVRQLGRASRLS